VKVPARRRPQQKRQLQEEQKRADAAALAEVKALAKTLEVPLAKVAKLLADDREGYVALATLAPAGEPAVALDKRSLLTKGTVDAYIAAVLKLWRLQVVHGNSNTEDPRGATVRGFLEQQSWQRGKHDRASYKDCEGDSI
jgi:hypothetical protein